MPAYLFFNLKPVMHFSKIQASSMNFLTSVGGLDISKEHLALSGTPILSNILTRHQKITLKPSCCVTVVLKLFLIFLSPLGLILYICANRQGPYGSTAFIHAALSTFISFSMLETKKGVCQGEILRNVNCSVSVCGARDILL